MVVGNTVDESLLVDVFAGKLLLLPADVPASATEERVAVSGC